MRAYGDEPSDREATGGSCSCMSAVHGSTSSLKQARDHLRMAYIYMHTSHTYTCLDATYQLQAGGVHRKHRKSGLAAH